MSRIVLDRDKVDAAAVNAGTPLLASGYTVPVFAPDSIQVDANGWVSVVTGVGTDLAVVVSYAPGFVLWVEW